MHFRKIFPQRVRQLTRKFNEPFRGTGVFHVNASLPSFLAIFAIQVIFISLLYYSLPKVTIV